MLKNTIEITELHPFVFFEKVLMTRTERYSGRVIRMIRTEGYSGRAKKMRWYLVDITSTESYSGGVIRMLCQLVGVFSVERASVLLTRFFK